MSDPTADPRPSVSVYDVVFTSVGADDRSSMPIGNGELCANVWSTNSGVHFYLSRSDALSELDRTLKLARYDVTFDPNPFRQPAHFAQRLDLLNGCIDLSVSSQDGLDIHITIHVDPEDDTLRLHAEASAAIEVSVSVFNWREFPNAAVEAAGMFWDEGDRDLLPELAAIEESADLAWTDSDGIHVLHRNQASVVPGVAALHGIDELETEVPDLLTGRVFGSSTKLSGPFRIANGALHTRERLSEVDVCVHTYSSQGATVRTALQALSRPVADYVESAQRTREYWTEYWARSWIEVGGDTYRTAEYADNVARAASMSTLAQRAPFHGSPVTRAYLLTKWMHACGNRGTMPLLYNGGLFTTMPGAGSHLKLDSFGTAFTAAPAGDPTLDLNPDERSWTIENLWQNLRLPYYSVLQRGEPEALLPVFAYYRRFWSVNRARAARHHSARGQWNTEMTLSCGLQSPGIYGANRNLRAAGQARNRWGGSINLSPGLELSNLMFDYWHFTGDKQFLLDEALPYAKDLAEFAVSKYATDRHGKIQFTELHSLETYFDTTDPLPVVAGYRRLAQNVLGLPEGLVSDRVVFERFAESLPPLPTEITDDGSLALAPAAHHDGQRMNVESPELYAVYPFDLGAQIDPDVLSTTWRHVLRKSGAFRPRVIGESLGNPSYSGWQYLAPTAARMGLMSEAVVAIEHNAQLTNPGFAFPAMWGPIYDAVPDVDHGANILNTLHELVDRCIEDPDAAAALPEGWTVRFRVFDRAGIPVEGSIREGSLVSS